MFGEISLAWSCIPQWLNIQERHIKKINDLCKQTQITTGKIKKKKIGQTGEKKNSFQLRHITIIQSENKASWEITFKCIINKRENEEGNNLQENIVNWKWLKVQFEARFVEMLFISLL